MIVKVLFNIVTEITSVQIKRHCFDLQLAETFSVTRAHTLTVLGILIKKHIF